MSYEKDARKYNSNFAGTTIAVPGTITVLPW